MRLDPNRPFPDFRASLVEAPGHTYQIFDPVAFRPLIKKTAKLLGQVRKEIPGIQAIAASGHSGLCVAAALSYTTGLPMLAVRRRKGETLHDLSHVNGYIGAKQYVIVDDLISTGKTMSRIIKSIHEVAQECPVGYSPQLAAIILYDTDYPVDARPFVELDGAPWQKQRNIPIYVLNHCEEPSRPGDNFVTEVKVR